MRSQSADKYRNLQHRFILPEQVSFPRWPFKIVYAGLLGVAQNILELIERMDFKGMGAELHLFGGGNQAGKIEDYVRTHDKGIFYHGSLPKEQMRKELTCYLKFVIHFPDNSLWRFIVEPESDYVFLAYHRLSYTNIIIQFIRQCYS